MLMASLCRLRIFKATSGVAAEAATPVYLEK
jgi:hypothetical protein